MPDAFRNSLPKAEVSLPMSHVLSWHLVKLPVLFSEHIVVMRHAGPKYKLLLWRASPAKYRTTTHC